MMITSAETIYIKCLMLVPIMTFLFAEQLFRCWMRKRVKKTIAPWEVPSKFIIFAVSMGATLGIEKQKFAVGQSNPVLLLLFFLYFFASVFPSTFIVPDLLLSLVLFFFISFCFATNKTIPSLLNCLFMFYACLLCTQIPVCWLPGFLIASHFAEKKEKKKHPTADCFHLPGYDALPLALPS